MIWSWVGFVLLLFNLALPNRSGQPSNTIALVAYQLVAVRGATAYRPTLAPLLPLHARKISCHLSYILGLTTRRTEKLAKDRVRGPHIRIAQKLINWLGAGIGIVIGIHHTSIIEKARGNIGTGKGREPLLRD
jgi:hypothetical protein